MKISSNFHEYYDALRATDQDDDPFYVRIKKDIEFPPLGPYERSSGERLTNEENANHIWRFMWSVASPWIQNGAIGFCGRVYPFLVIGRNKNTKVAYSFERARKLVQEYKEYDLDNKLVDLKKEKTTILNNMDTPRNRWNRPNEVLISEWDAILQNDRNLIGDEAFRYFRAPVLLGIRTSQYPWKITVNPILRPFDFHQVMTPHQAYQELSMYIGNNLANLDRKEPRPISDQLKAESKGFDKFSFKNQKNRKVSHRGDW